MFTINETKVATNTLNIIINVVDGLNILYIVIIRGIYADNHTNVHTYNGSD